MNEEVYMAKPPREFHWRRSETRNHVPPPVLQAQRRSFLGFDQGWVHDVRYLLQQRRAAMLWAESQLSIAA